MTVQEQRQQLVSGAHIVGSPKSEAGRHTVALPPDAFEPLVEQLERFVGPEPSASVCSPATRADRSARACGSTSGRGPERGGLPDLHFHDLRHAAATLAAETGAGVKQIMYRIGHSSP